MNAQFKKMRISTPTSPVMQKLLPVVVERRCRAIQSALPKRISLPENLEFTPEVLLQTKMRIHLEKQMVGEDGGVPVDATKQVIKARLQQKRLNKTRMQLLRQQVGRDPLESEFNNSSGRG